jgi:hypothetical protein
MRATMLVVYLKELRDSLRDRRHGADGVFRLDHHRLR